jgi:23S rRNA pseudouridine2605 synthase
MLERLQKILSARGIASRRKSEEYILAGLVKVNGKVAELGQKADPEKDTIEVEGKVLTDRAEMLYYLLNKPVGIETTNATIEGQQTVKDLLPKELQGKIFPVGRLDKDSGGLLLLTNDGVLAFRLTHPKFDHEKEYEVKVGNDIKNGALQKLEEGIMIDGSKTKPAKIERLAPNRFLITLTEGRNRQIRRMSQKVGSPVDTLTRIRIMTLTDPKLLPGKLRKLREDEKVALLKSVELDAA